MSAPARVLAALAARGETLATAESLTGGLVAQTLTDVPGASQVFVGGVVAYTALLKQQLLGVPAAVVSAHGVVSAETAQAMALGVRQRLASTWGIATTGVAGPSEQEGHPVGTVFVAISGPFGDAVRQLALSGDRAEVRAATCAQVLGLVEEQLAQPE